jgi:hypothetical protein
MKFRPGAVLVENASNGHALISRLLESFPSMNFVPINPKGSKAERLARHRKAIAAGAISLQIKEPWNDVYIFEFVNHPKNGSDQVDPTTQLLDWEPQNRGLAPSGPLHAGPAGAYASSVRHGFAFSSKTPGIVRGLNRPFFRKW